MGTQAGKQQKRVKFDDGSEILLPADAVLQPRHKPSEPLNINMNEGDEIEAGADDVLAGEEE